MFEIRYDGDKFVLPELNCDCGMEHGYPDMDIYIGEGIVDNIPQYLSARDLGKSLLVVTDNVVYAKAAKQVISVLEQAGYTVDLCLLEREGRLIPNEVALGEILLSLKNSTQCLVAVGSGCITDLTRYAAHVSKLPFALVGTAPSMDGYTSVAAPLTYGNLKINKPANFAKVLIFDLNIMSKAPYHMLMAGFGDVIGKYIAQADWTLGGIINQEVVCPLCIGMTTQAVERCINNIDEIKQSSLAGVRALIEGLIISGITILIVGHTRPVASNEHSMAHYWEMMQLLAGTTPSQHGLSVGVATVYCLQFYELYLQQDFVNFDLETAKRKHLAPEEHRQLIRDKFSDKIGNAIINDNHDICLPWSEVERRCLSLIENHDLIKEKMSFLPKARDLIKLYEEIDFPWPYNKIGIDDQLLLNSLLYAKEYRARYNFFKSAGELGILSDLVDEVLTRL